MWVEPFCDSNHNSRGFPRRSNGIFIDFINKKNVSKEYVLVSTFFNRCEKFGMKEVNVELSIPISIMSLIFISWTQPAHLICNSLDLDGTPRQASNNVMP